VSLPDLASFVTNEIGMCMLFGCVYYYT